MVGRIRRPGRGRSGRRTRTSATTARPPSVKQAHAQVKAVAQKGRPGPGHNSNPNPRPTNEPPLPQPLPPGHKLDAAGRLHGPDGDFAHNPNKARQGHTRKSEYDSGYSAATHRMMARMYTVEGQMQGRVPLGPDGKPIPREQLTWIDGYGRRIPFHELTYDHSPSAAYNWSYGGGNNTSRAVRDAWADNPNILRAMRGPGPDGNFARGSGGVPFRQDVGPDYTPN